MNAVKDSSVLKQLAARWAMLASRERVLSGSAALLIIVALLWSIAIAPALSQLRQARVAAPQLDAALQLMISQANEAASLKAQRILGYDESLRSLENSIKTLGTGATLNVSDGRASITLRGVSGDALAQWLPQVRSNARLVPSELRLKQAGSVAAPATATLWDGSIVLNLPAR